MKDNALIIARFLLKVAKRKEQKALSRWESLSDENASFVERLNKFWSLPLNEGTQPSLGETRERLISRINASEKKQTKRAAVFYLTRIAAIFIFTVIVAGTSIFVASKTGALSQNNQIQVSTNAGQKSKVILPDGSQVWLNAETTLNYEQNAQQRSVTLTGEAYFEVTHVSNRPFVVSTGEAKIKVLGTKFNVSHYPDSKITDAALLNGKITLTVNKTGKVVELSPGQKVVYDSEKQVLTKSDYKVKDEISWKQGILHFENEPFNEIIRELERYYDVKFSYEPQAFEEIHYTGSVDNMEISKVLEFINLTIPITYEVNNKTIVLKLR